MRTTRVWRRLLGVENTVIESVDLEPDGRGGEQLIARVRPRVVPGHGARAAGGAALAMT
ncbi:MAG: hypothetical protein ACRDQU_01755 [Pseudonocardiaceae bacterium]